MDISFDQSSSSLGPSLSLRSGQRPQHPTSHYMYVPAAAHSRTTSASKFSYRNVGESIDDRLILRGHHHHNNNTADSIADERRSNNNTNNDSKPPPAHRVQVRGIMDRNGNDTTTEQHRNEQQHRQQQTFLSNSSIVSNSSTVIVHGGNETPPPEMMMIDGEIPTNEDKDKEESGVDYRRPYYGSSSPRHPRHSSQQQRGIGGGNRGADHDDNDEDKPAPVSNMSLSSASFLARILSGTGGEKETEQKKHEPSSVSTSKKLFGLGVTPSPRPTHIHHTRVPSLLIETPPLYAEEDKMNRNSHREGYEGNDEGGSSTCSGRGRWNEVNAAQQQDQRHQPKAKTSISAAAATLAAVRNTGGRDNNITYDTSSTHNAAKGTNSYESTSFQPHSSVHHAPPKPRATASSYPSRVMLTSPPTQSQQKAPVSYTDTLSPLRLQLFFDEQSALNSNSPTPLTDQISRRFYNKEKAQTNGVGEASGNRFGEVNNNNNSNNSPPRLQHPDDRRSRVSPESAVRRGLGLVVRSPSSPPHLHHMHAANGGSSFSFGPPRNSFDLRSNGAFYTSPTKIEGFSVDREPTSAGISPRRNQPAIDAMFNLKGKKSPPITNLRYAPSPALLTRGPPASSQLRTTKMYMHDHHYPNNDQQSVKEEEEEELPPKDESAIDEDEEDYQKNLDDDHRHAHFSAIPERFTGNFADVSLGLRAATSPFVGDNVNNQSQPSTGGVGGMGAYRRDLKGPTAIGNPIVYSRSQYGKRRYVPQAQIDFFNSYHGHRQASSSSYFSPTPSALVEEVIGGPFFDTTEHHQNQDEKAKEERHRISMDSLLTIAGLLESQGLNPMADDANYRIAMHHRKEDNFLFALESALIGDYVTRYHPLKRSGSGKNGVRGGTASPSGVFFSKNGSVINKDPVERFIQIKLEEPSDSYRRNVCADREFPIPYLIVKVAESDSAEVISRFRLSNLVGVTRDVSHPSFGPHRVFRDGSVGFQGVLFEDEPMCPDPDRCTEEAQHFYKQRQLALLAALSDKAIGIHGKRLVSATTAGRAATSVSPASGAPHRLLHADNAFVLWFLDCNTLEADQLILCAHTAQSAGFWVNVMKGIIAVNGSRKLPVPAETSFNFGGAIGLGASELSVYQAIQERRVRGEEEADGEVIGAQLTNNIAEQSNIPSVSRRGEQQERNDTVMSNISSPEGLNVSERQPRRQQQQQRPASQADMTVMTNETLAREGADGNNSSPTPAAQRTLAEVNANTSPHEFSGPTRSPPLNQRRLSSIRNKNAEKFSSRYYIPKEVYVDPATGEPVAEDGLTRSDRLHIRRQRPPMVYLFRKARYLIDVKNNDSRFFEF